MIQIKNKFKTHFEEEYEFIIAVAMKLHERLGAGLNAAIYTDAFKKELTSTWLWYDTVKKYSIDFENSSSDQAPQVDFTVGNRIGIKISSCCDSLEREEWTVLNQKQKCLTILSINFYDELLTIKNVTSDLEQLEFQQVC